MPGLRFVVSDPGSPAAAAALRAYYDDIVGRYHGRPALAAETDSAQVDEPSDDLQGDTGVFLLALHNGRAVACGGVRFVDSGTGDLTRIHVDAQARGSGTGAALIRELEVLALGAGRTRLRLTVRSDLIEARRLYARLGYAEVAPFNTEPYADHWLAKELRPPS